MAGLGKFEQAIDKAFNILGELGETFPSDVTPELIFAELKSTRTLLNNYSKDEIAAAPKMTDMNKIWCLKFMNIITTYLFAARPSYLPLVSCRMVQLLIKHGFCSDSVAGLLLYSHTVISILQDIEEGYTWGNFAHALINNSDEKYVAPKLKLYFHYSISFWVEPIQATFSILRHTYKEALVAGHVESATICSIGYIEKSLLCGAKLSILEEECASFASKTERVRSFDA